jgi:hypothetical protein
MEMPGFLSRKKGPPSLKKAASRSIVASLILHGTLLLVATIFVISHIMYNRESTFKGQPPPAKTYEPRKVELKVKVSRQQKSSSRPSMAPRLVSSRESAHLALPEIKVDSKLVSTTFQPKFKAVTGKGLGAGLGTGYGTSGFGEGVSAINFFGIQGKGERIAIMVDVSVSMIETGEKAGKGFTDYMRVKQRVGAVVDSLKDGTLFNVIVFADACSEMEPKMVFANNETRKEAKQFIQPYNTDRNNYGLTSGNFHGSGGLRAAGGTTRMDLALAAAMKDGADLIMIITDGLPEVKKILEPEQMEAYNAMRSNWATANAGAVAAAQANMQAYQAQVAAMPATAVRVWVPEQPARPPRPAELKEGARPDPGSPAVSAHWETHVQTPSVGGGPPAMPAPPPPPEPGMWHLPEFIRHVTLMYEEIYKPKGLKPPVICMIGYQTDKEGDMFMRQMAATYKGQYRLVSSMK